MDVEPFEPPKYIASLIGAINDGAKAAQASALGFAAVGLYLVLTALSTTDEDLLLDRATVISQVGVQVPVVGAFYVAPWVFLALHVFALNRYDMLAANLAQFNADLEAHVPRKADRERCRYLLANVEFVQEVTAIPGSPLHSRMWLLAFVAVMVVLPVFAIILTQVSALRYQSELGNWTQRAALAADLVLLARFFVRHRELLHVRPRRFRASRWLRWLLLRITPNRRALAAAVRCLHWGEARWLPALVMALDLAWVNLPGWDATSVRGWEEMRVIRLSWLSEHVVEEGYSPFYEEVRLVAMVLRFPLDLIVCPMVRNGVGCRYLTITGRTLVRRTWDEKAITVLADAFRTYDEADESRRFRTATSDAEADVAFAAIEPIDLFGRSLRFARLDGSRLFAVDLEQADLTRANLRNALLPRGRLNYAHLPFADLSEARLDDADLEGAVLSFAHMEHTNLTGARLQRAEADYAHLEGALFAEANLERASLDKAHCEGTSFFKAHLEGASLDDSHLRRADLRKAHLGGSWLGSASLSGADLREADLAGTVLSHANLEQANLTGADFRGSDLTDATFGPLADAQAASPPFLGFNDVTRSDLIESIASALPAVPEKDGSEWWHEPHIDGQLLVSAKQWQQFGAGWMGRWLTKDAAVFGPARAGFLVDHVAAISPAAAEGIASYEGENLDIGCALLAGASAGQIDLDYITSEDIRTMLREKHFECPVRDARSH